MVPCDNSFSSRVSKAAEHRRCGRPLEGRSGSGAVIFHPGWAAVATLALFLFSLGAGIARGAEAPTPSVDAHLGPCSVDFTVTDQKFQPLYNARIHAHFRYGFWGTRTMDVEVGTNSSGKARFIGLPAKLRRPPLEFAVTFGRAFKGWFWTGLSCKNHAQVVLDVH